MAEESARNVDKQQEEETGCEAVCPECGSDMTCCEPDTKHATHKCEKGHEWT